MLINLLLLGSWALAEAAGRWLTAPCGPIIEPPEVELPEHPTLLEILSAPLPPSATACNCGGWAAPPMSAVSGMLNLADPHFSRETWTGCTGTGRQSCPSSCGDIWLSHGLQGTEPLASADPPRWMHLSISPTNRSRWPWFSR